jgi:succinate dehydrogenase / fumarate reductase cytochrome b subunit
MGTTHRTTSLRWALSYRGREGMWTWILHRVTGLGVLLFLIIHVVETALVIYRPDLYDDALGLYKSAFFRFGELAVFFGVLFHAVNGLRIIIQDFWPYAMQRQRQLAWGVAVVVVVTMLPVTWMMIAPLFGLAEEPGAERHRARVEAEGTVVAASPAPVVEVVQ